MRMLRATVATLVVIGLGHSAHTLGGGAGPQPLAVTVLALLVAPLVWAVVRGRATASRMVLAMAAGQLVTHAALVAMAPGSGTAAAAHLHGDAALVVAAPPAGGADLTAALHLTPGMLLAHALATVLAAVLLSHGEDAVRAAVRQLLPDRPPVGTMVGRRPLAPPARPAVLTGRAVGPVGGRGPPLPVS
ncbi:hypothetical protein GCM10023168_17600 [Fodinibacter luteus]|uniref:MFS transporter n=1 Tax=Fodinibacter luteus TaxID=552064 RepID=A0ABP8KDZ5_9MICO